MPHLVFLRSCPTLSDLGPAEQRQASQRFWNFLITDEISRYHEHLMAATEDTFASDQNVQHLQVLVPFLSGMPLDDRESREAFEDTREFLELSSLAFSFLESHYAEPLASYRRARQLADLRSPEREKRWVGTGWIFRVQGAKKEIFQKLRAAGVRCALLTGQERLGPDDATHVACTVEMAPLTRHWQVAVLDEVQLVTDANRGFAWTRALLGVNARQLHLCGAHEPATPLEDDQK
ncbi:ATP-dependent RNA helicase SUPV3L1 [Durusdinium trenchii]|uniref:Mitochondrial (Suppressor of var1 3-like protein 1) (SUV3-like protein 1) n=1 Tax=Durusdinium trenchii TaxID=1381693 RepID=A0ABP0J2H6_9DINO